MFVPMKSAQDESFVTLIEGTRFSVELFSSYGGRENVQKIISFSYFNTRTEARTTAALALGSPAAMYLGMRNTEGAELQTYENHTAWKGDIISARIVAHDEENSGSSQNYAYEDLTLSY